MNFVDSLEIYDRGLGDLSLLHGAERLVFMLMDFDNLMEMEGWEHFFMYDSHFVWYSEMKEWLQAIGDEASLAVLRDFENRLNASGVPLSPAGIEGFTSGGETWSRACSAWTDQYCDLRSDRWAKASAYLETQGLHLRA